LGNIPGAPEDTRLTLRQADQTRTDFVRRIGLQLNDMFRKGKVEKIGRGRAMRWKLASRN
jgi:hypothetical protein